MFSLVNPGGAKPLLSTQKRWHLFSAPVPALGLRFNLSVASLILEALGGGVKDLFGPGPFFNFDKETKTIAPAAHF